MVGIGASLLAGLGSSIISGAVSNLFNKSSEERAVARSKELMNYQNMLQRSNNMEAMSLLRDSKQRAGINLNAEQGFSPSLTPPSATQVPMQTAMDFSMLANANEANARARDINLSADLKERELRGRNNADEIVSEGKITSGVSLQSDGTYEFQVVSDRGTPVNSVEGFHALEEYVEYAKSKIHKWNNDFEAEKLRSAVLKYQNDNDISKSIAKLPKSQLDLLVSNKAVQDALSKVYQEQGNLYIAETDLAKLQKESMENSSLGVIIDKIGQDMDNGNYLGVLGGIVKALFFSALQSVNVNVGFGRSKSTVSSTVSRN